MGILAFLGLKKYDDSIYKLYRNIVAQARIASFYEDHGVPDTLNGRFDLISLHVYIVMRRLKEIDGEGVKLSQDLFDVMFADMDKNLREMGVGDLRVGKRIKAMATAFYGRIKAYDEAIAGVEGAELTASLRRNLFAEGDPTEQQLKSIAQYLEREINSSKNWTIEGLKRGDVIFGMVPSAGNEVSDEQAI